MNPIDVYDLFYDKQNNDLRIMKLRAMQHHCFANGDMNSVGRIAKFLDEAIDLQKRMDDFFNDYIKKN